MYIETTEKLLDFIEKSPTAFQAVDEMQKRLTENGFEVLSEKEYWKLVPGGNFLYPGKGIQSISYHGESQRFTIF